MMSKARCFCPSRNILIRLTSGLVLLAAIGVTLSRLGQQTATHIPRARDTSSLTTSPRHEKHLASFDDYEADPEEQQEALEQFEAISDSSLALHREEMPAYWRVMRWATHQQASSVEARINKDLRFNDLMQDAKQYRGQAVAFDLNVRRILSYEAPPNPLNIQRLYEIWGWTDESKAWLFVCVTPELPEGLKEGVSVHERVRFVGYFLKLQGYMEANAPPRATPLSAPLCLGRVLWNPAVSVQRSKTGNNWSVTSYITASLMVVAATLFLATCMRRRRLPVMPANRPGEWMRTVKP